MRRRILGMIAATGIAAGSALLSLGGVASAAPGPGNCSPPGSEISMFTPNPPSFYGVAPGLIVSAFCAPGRVPPPPT